MQATAMFSSPRHRVSRGQRPGALRFAAAGCATPSRAAGAPRYAVDRAGPAEGGLGARALDLTWPVALCGIVGGFVAIVGLRLAGL